MTFEVLLLYCGLKILLWVKNINKCMLTQLQLLTSCCPFKIIYFYFIKLWKQLKIRFCYCKSRSVFRNKYY